MANVRIWNKTQTSSFIADNFERATPLDLTGLVGNWGLNEINGLTAFDLSQNSLNGNLLNFDSTDRVEDAPFTELTPAPPVAANLNASETYTEDTILNLTDIVVSDTDSSSVAVTLSLSDVAAGSLSTATSGTLTSTFSGGVWSASGPIADVNSLLAGVTYTPSANYNSNFSIATSISDGLAPVVTGSKMMTGVPVNDTAVISGTNTGSVTEDGGEGEFTSGSLSVSDADNGEGFFVSTLPLEGSYGSFSFENGAWSYRLANESAAVQGLAARDLVTDTLTVTTVDGTTETITVTINGSNDAPIVASTDQSSVGLMPAVINESENNNTLESADVISRLQFGVAPNADIGDASLPRVSINGIIGPGDGYQNDVDFFAFTLLAGETITLDIDYGSGLGTNVDTILGFYNSTGTLLLQNDDYDPSVGGGGSTSGLDSYLQYTVTAGGTYYAAVTAFPNFGSSGLIFNNTAIESYNNGDYVLNVSLDAHALMGDATGGVTELVTPAGNLTDTGTLSFTDVDLTDFHTISEVTNSEGALGTLAASVSTDTTGTGLGGEITWNYTVAASAV